MVKRASWEANASFDRFFYAKRAGELGHLLFFVGK